jgi:hypothetical protein
MAVRQPSARRGPTLERIRIADQLAEDAPAIVQIVEEGERQAETRAREANAERDRRLREEEERRREEDFAHRLRPEHLRDREQARLARQEDLRREPRLQRGKMLLSEELIEEGDARIVTTIADALRGHIWFLGSNQTEVPLYTSDHPIVKREHVREKFRSNGGFGSPGIEVALPLTPEFVLILVERRVHAYMGRFEHTVWPLRPESVLYYNAMQVEQSTRQVFASADVFATAREICHERAAARDPSRVRVEVSNGGTYVDIKSIGAPGTTEPSDGTS